MRIPDTDYAYLSAAEMRAIIDRAHAMRAAAVASALRSATGRLANLFRLAASRRRHAPAWCRDQPASVGPRAGMTS